VVEYQGREFVEDESIMGASEKMIFYIKEMVANISSQPPQLLNPFIMAKLDVESVRNFVFPPVFKEVNRFTVRKYGVPGGASIVKDEREALVGTAKATLRLAEKKKTVKDVAKDIKCNLTANTGHNGGERKITPPVLLEVYCNMTELVRLRSELINAASETAILQKIYNSQVEKCGKSHLEPLIDESISFPSLFDPATAEQYINYTDDGPGHQCNIGLAISEFDPSLLTNLNYKHPDAFKMSVLT